eukprot:7288407-Pyramimonas_sp.AAC.1
MPPGRGWSRCPRTDNSPTACWSSTLCRECRLHTTTLMANNRLEPGDDVSVRDSPFPDSDSTQWPCEVTLDGGARSIGQGEQVSGAGAILWHHNPSTGALRVLAIAI